MSAPGVGTTGPTGRERRGLAQAIALAQPAVRRAAPNPGVGCVVVDADGVIVGAGATAGARGPHPAGGAPHAGPAPAPRPP
ncbi:MAG: hypothetical protein JJT89_18515, partial [Nitriliruptoraceae bacterium]|nr:hypothetical protein [Nitriliruptoraceae bacterium]